MPECTFLLPLALTIFGFSTSSAESERFSGLPLPPELTVLFSALELFSPREVLRRRRL